MRLHGLLLLTLVLSLKGYSQQCNAITLESITDPGPYSYDIMTEGDGMRNGPDYNGATVYYPVDAEPPYASVVLSPGYWSGQESVADWGPFYASHGFIAMTIGTNFLWDSPDTRAEGLLDAIETLRQENTREASPLMGKIDLDRFVASGWSMGGGGAQRAAVMDGSLKAVVALTPWLSTSSNAADLNHAVPVLILSGEDDPTAPPSSHANLHYNWTPATTNKLKFEVTNGDHHVADGPYGAQGDLGKTVISWLQYHLYGKMCFCPLFILQPLTASEYLTNIVCETLTSSEDALNSKGSVFSIYPNPVTSELTLETELAGTVEYELVSILGQRILSGVMRLNTTQIDLSSLSQNVYFLRVGDEAIQIMKVD